VLVIVDLNQPVAGSVGTNSRVRKSRGVARWLQVEHICCRPFRLAMPHWFDLGSVSTPRSSNRTCRSPASGSRTKHHAFTHGT
jgi:hypothetical protein